MFEATLFKVAFIEYLFKHIKESGDTMSAITQRQVMWDGTKSNVMNVTSAEGNLSVFTYGNGTATLKVSIDILKDGMTFDDLTWTDRFLVAMKNGNTNATVSSEGNYITFVGDVKYVKFDNVSGFDKIEASTY